MTEVKPILKWAGGKRWLAPKVEKLWKESDSDRLVEPFVGGAAVVLQIQPENALLNDINKHLINFYKQIQDGLIVSEIEMKNEEEHYYDLRDRFNELMHAEKHETQEAAEIFYYMNRTGFNGLCRFNQKGEFNVPFGRYATINYKKDFTDYQPLFNKWKLTTGDFEKLEPNSSDFIYSDPPYVEGFTSYSGNSFDWSDQKRLAEWLGDHEGPVVASNLATDEIVKLYEENGFTIEEIEGPRSISSDGNREPVLEMFARRNI